MSSQTNSIPSYVTIYRMMLYRYCITMLQTDDIHLQPDFIHYLEALDCAEDDSEVVEEEDESVQDEVDESNHWKGVSTKHPSKLRSRMKVQSFQNLSKGEKRSFKREQKQQTKVERSRNQKKFGHRRSLYRNKGFYEANFWQEEVVCEPLPSAKRSVKQNDIYKLTRIQIMEGIRQYTIVKVEQPVPEVSDEEMELYRAEGRHYQFERERCELLAEDEKEENAAEEALAFCAVEISMPESKKSFVDITMESSTKNFVKKYKKLLTTTREEEEEDSFKLKNKKEKKTARQFVRNELSKQYREKKSIKTRRIKKDREVKLLPYASVHFGNDVDQYFEYFDSSLSPKYKYNYDYDCHVRDWSKCIKVSKVDQHTAFKTSEDEVNGWQWFWDSIK